VIEAIDLSDEELARIRHLLPGSEPRLELPAGAPGETSEAGAAGAAAPRRILPVADTRLDGNELRYVTECIESSWISSAGRFVREFEERFAAEAGCRHGVACASGTSALHLALATLGIGPGDEVIVPTFTMIATANAVSYTGAVPVLVDAEPVTCNLDVDQLAAKVTARTRAVVVVHTYGHPADVEPVLELARRRGLAVVEDAAEAHGATYHGRRVGSFGDAAVFSFYGNKIVSTGEGGMVTTNDPELARLARRLREHAFSEDRHFWHRYLGFNYRMGNLQAAVGLAQTERLDELVAVRRRNAHRYQELLREVPGLLLPGEMPGVESVYWMYALRVMDDFGCSRDELRRRLARQGIETRSFFVPIHLQPIYHRRYRGQSYPVSEELCRQGLYLPSGPSLTACEIAWVARQVGAARAG
jgi:perosamine synthetase